MEPDIFTHCWNGDAAAALALLDASPGLVNARDTTLHGGGYTPLLYAAYTGAHELVAQLLRRGAAVDAANDAGCTALMLAAQQGHIATAALLLAQGADPTRTDADRGFSAIDLAFDHPGVAGLLATGRLPPGAPPEAIAAAATASAEFPSCAPPEALRGPPELSVTSCAVSLRLAATGRELCPLTRTAPAAAGSVGLTTVILRPATAIALDELQLLPPHEQRQQASAPLGLTLADTARSTVVDVIATLTLSFVVSWAPVPPPSYHPTPPHRRQRQQQLSPDGTSSEADATDSPGAPPPRVPLPPSLFEVAVLQLAPTGSGITIPVGAGASTSTRPAPPSLLLGTPALPPVLPPARGAPPAAAAWLHAHDSSLVAAGGAGTPFPADTRSTDVAVAGSSSGGSQGGLGSAVPARGVAAGVVFRGNVSAGGAQAQPASTAAAAAFPLTHSVTKVTVTLPLRLAASTDSGGSSSGGGLVPLACDATVRFVSKVRCVNALGRSAWSGQSEPARAAVRLTVDARGISEAALRRERREATEAAAAAAAMADVQASALPPLARSGRRRSSAAGAVPVAAGLPAATSLPLPAPPPATAPPQAGARPQSGGRHRAQGPPVTV